MKSEKTRFRSYHVFYPAFFAGYFFLLYFLLYRPGGLSPFQINFHFFANVIGSLSKRFMAEASVYAFLLYLIHYSRKKWFRVILITLFLLAFFLNVMAAYYFYMTRTNIHWYVIKGLQWNLFLSVLHGRALLLFTALLAAVIVLAVCLYRIKSDSHVPLSKRLIFLSLFAGLFYNGNFYASVYDYNKTIFGDDAHQKMQYNIFELDKSGLMTLVNAFRDEYFPPSFKKEALTTDETQYLASIGLGDKLTVPSDFHPKEIVLVVFENVNQSFLSHYNSEIPGTTPFLDSLITTYPHLDDFYPSGTYTIYGLSSILCSHLNTARMESDSKVECLPDLLRKAGYQTEFIRGFSKYYIHENEFFSKIGYNQITAQEDFEKKFPNFKNERPDLFQGWGYSDDYVFNEAVEKLKENRGQKLFLTLLTVDTHANGGRCYRPRTQSDPKNNELFSVTCLDETVKNFFTKLQTEGLFDQDLLVVLTSDHLYSSYSDIPGDQSWDSFSSMPGRTPMIFASKQPVSFRATSGSQVDLAPTLLDLLDLDAPPAFMGKSLIANSQTVPMGLDGTNAYMVVNHQYVRLNLTNSAVTADSSSGRSGDFIKVVSANPNEIDTRIEALRREKQQGEGDTNSALLKWFKNQW